jgi:S-formylglutathione hydrolase
MKTISENRAFGGVQGVYSHTSDACACDMTFGLFLPAEAERDPVPVLWYLSGLTCTHENAMVKAGAQKWAAEAGVALVFPDTSPRGAGVADNAAFDLGQGAGFYLNATEAPWKPHFRMSFPGRFRSVSAFAPIAHPTTSDWGRKQFAAYLGPDEAKWVAHDATLLMKKRGFDGPILIDQGGSDQFLDLLQPEALAKAMVARRQEGAFRIQKGYDHSYFFVASFMEEHMGFHAQALYD